MNGVRLVMKSSKCLSYRRIGFLCGFILDDTTLRQIVVMKICCDMSIFAICLSPSFIAFLYDAKAGERVLK